MLKVFCLVDETLHKPAYGTVGPNVSTAYTNILYKSHNHIYFYI